MSTFSNSASANSAKKNTQFKIITKPLSGGTKQQRKYLMEVWIIRRDFKQLLAYLYFKQLLVIAYLATLVALKQATLR